MTMYQLTTYATELDAPPWHQDVAGALIDLIGRNPWQPVVELQGDVDDAWRPFDRALAIKTFERQKSLIMRTGADLSVDASLSSFQRVNNARFSMMSPVFERRSAGDVEDFAARMLAVLPQASDAVVSADDDQMMFKRERGLRRLPELIRQIGWLHVLCPRTYPLFYDRDVLLAAPCHRVEERADGTIWIWAYPHPLEFETPEARDATAALHQYLYTHAKRSRVT